MYSSLAGAKKCAKQLQHILDAAGVDYPLAKCQAAVARAGGYKSWHELTGRVSARTGTHVPYDYWGKLLEVLPEPCRAPIAWHLDGEAISSPKKPLPEKWIRAVVPYAVGLEVIHRSRSPILQPGTGKGQRLRLDIVSGILLNMEGGDDFTLRLDPESLIVTAPDKPGELLPRLRSKSGFDAALKAVIDAGILKVENGVTRVLTPEDPALRAEILDRARDWNVQKMPKLNPFEVEPEFWAAVQHQYDIDRAEAGPKAPYDDLDHRGVLLNSRFSILHEFERMQRVVDAMPDWVRLSVASIWCDSLACACYSVELKLGMYRDRIPEEICDCFLTVCEGFNGLSVNHGSKSKQFDCKWPADEAYYANIDFPEVDDRAIDMD